MLLTTVARSVYIPLLHTARLNPKTRALGLMIFSEGGLSYEYSVALPLEEGRAVRAFDVDRISCGKSLQPRQIHQ